MVWQQVIMQAVLFIASLLLVWLVARATLFVWRKVFLRNAGKTETNLRTMLFRATKRPTFYLILLFGWQASVERVLLLPELRDQAWVLTYAPVISQLFFVAIALVVARLSYAALEAVFSRYAAGAANRANNGLDDMFIQMGVKLSRVIIYFAALIAILDRLNVNVTGFIATAGVASLAMAFAAQETLANMIAGLTILLDRPYRVGDRIEMATGEIIGDVVEIGLRSTRILSFDNTMIIVPNKDMTGSRLINHSSPSSHFRIRTYVRVAYGTDLEKAKELVRAACRESPFILSEPAPEVYVNQLAESAVMLLLICWIRDYRERIMALDGLLLAINRHFAEAGITIPFPQQTVHLHAYEPIPKNEQENGSRRA